MLETAEQQVDRRSIQFSSSRLSKWIPRDERPFKSWMDMEWRRQSFFSIISCSSRSRMDSFIVDFVDFQNALEIVSRKNLKITREIIAIVRSLTWAGEMILSECCGSQLSPPGIWHIHRFSFGKLRLMPDSSYQLHFTLTHRYIWSVRSDRAVVIIFYCTTYSTSTRREVRPMTFGGDLKTSFVFPLFSLEIVVDVFLSESP